MPTADDQDVIASIRKRPGMYVGSVCALGVARLVRELVSNSIDEFLAGRATRLDVTWDGDRICVSDDGGGIAIEPCGDGSPGPDVVHLTQHHDSASADDHAPPVHFVSAGNIGLCAVTALSAACTLRSWRGEELWEWRSERGRALGPPRRVESGNGRGTAIEIVPDPEIFSERLHPDSLRGQLIQAAHLFPGLRIGLGDEVYRSPNGLAGLLDVIDGRERVDAVAIRERREGIELDCALVRGDARAESPPAPYIVSWANGVRTEENGSHVDGVLDAIRTTRAPMPTTILVHVMTLEPRFAGPTKGSLAMGHVRDEVRECLLEHLTYTDPLFGPLTGARRRVWTAAVEHRGVTMPVKLRIHGPIDPHQVSQLTRDLDVDALERAAKETAAHQLEDGSLSLPTGARAADFLDRCLLTALTLDGGTAGVDAIAELGDAATPAQPRLTVELGFGWSGWTGFAAAWGR